MKPLKWKTDRRVINDLIPHPENPRRISKKDAKDLRASLTKFDLVEIPAINADDVILAGHQRLKIMQALGRGAEEIDVRVPSRKLTPAEVREYNIRSNKNTGEWNFDVLANNNSAEELVAWGFLEKELTGDPGGTADDPGDVEFSEELLISHNYVVLCFDNDMDWQVAQDRLNLKTVRDLIPRKDQGVGIGRVIKGAPIIARLKK